MEHPDHPPAALAADPLELPEHLRAVARAEIGETPERRRAALDELKACILALPDASDRLEDTSDLNLVRILRCRKFRVDKALKTTINLQRFNAKHPEWLAFDPAEVLKFSAFFRVMDQYDEKKRLVVTLHPVKNVPLFTDEYLATNPLGPPRFMIWAMDRISRNPHAQVCGVVEIASFHDVTFWDSLRLSKVVTLGLLSSVMTYIHKCVGMRLSAALIFEQPLFFSVLFPLVKPFMSAKTRDRMVLCGSDYERIQEVVGDISFLPEQLGGTVPEEACVHWVATELQQQQREAAVRAENQDPASRPTQQALHASQCDAHT